MCNNIIALIAMIALSGCGMLKPKTEQVTVKPVYADNVPIPKVDPTNLKPIEWKIMNKDELTKFLQTSPSDSVLYTLDENNSAVLVGNIEDLNRYIKSQQAVINYLIGIINSRKAGTK